MAKSWTNPLDRLIEADKKAGSVSAVDKLMEKKTSSPSPAEETTAIQPEVVDSLRYIKTNEIKVWEHKVDRKTSLGENFSEFIQGIKENGQLQPILVKKGKGPKDGYTLIYGERRWNACKELGIDVLCRVQNVNDFDAGISIIVENKDRESSTPYDFAMQLSEFLDHKIMTQSDMAKKMSISRQAMSKMMSFTKIPPELVAAIGDMRKITASMAELLKQICDRDPANRKKLVELSHVLKGGEITYNNLRAMFFEANEKKEVKFEPIKLVDEEGRSWGTIRLNNNNLLSINPPKDVASVLDLEKLKHNMLEALRKSIS